jgi:hypothetical protein
MEWSEKFPEQVVLSRGISRRNTSGKAFLEMTGLFIGDFSSLRSFEMTGWLNIFCFIV